MAVVKALIFLNAFSLFICLLIIFLDRIISNYGICKITINDDKEFTAKGGKSLLRTLFENKYFIPSACGGKGTCGYCRVKVLNEDIPVSPSESLIFTREEIKANYRLSCQLKVKTDLRIEIPSEYLEIREYKGSLESSESVTSDIKKIKIKLLEPDIIDFKPGQYVQIRVGGEAGTDYRAYSMASDPEEKNSIELNVKLIPDGLGSSYIHGLKEGEKIFFSGPYGDFFLRTDSARRIVCVAGGVGLAPIKSIVQAWSRQPSKRILELYYGSRTVKDLYDHDIFVKIGEENKNLRYFPALSQEDPEWKGARGYIHNIIQEKLTAGEESEAYLCGPPIMIDAVTKVLTEKGIPLERIYYDKF